MNISLSQSSSFCELLRKNDHTLEGHSEAVICLYFDSRKGANFLLSGSEDGCIKVWDTTKQGSGTCVQTIKCSSNEEDEEEAVTSICSGSQGDSRIFAAVGTSIFAVHTQQNDDKANYTTELFCHDSNDDEINQICAPSKKRPYLATADDTGTVQVFILDEQQQKQGKKLFKSLQGKHTTICSSILFPPNLPWCILSGGYDCQLVATDFSNGKTMWTYNMNDKCALERHAKKDHVAPSNQMVNPPFVQSIALKSYNSSKTTKKKQTSDVALVGLGNGTFCEVSAKTGEILAMQEDAHASGIVQVCPLGDDSGLVVTLGNDQMIKVWRRMTTGNITLIFPYKLLAEERHTEKLNTAVAQRKHDENEDGDSTTIVYTLYIADISNDISVYTLTVK
jgi:WD40 repeat protein